MEIKINKEVSFDVFAKLKIVDNLSMFVKECFKSAFFGPSINKIIIVVNCIDPEMTLGNDFENGLIIYSQYVKSKKFLEFHFKLNYKDIKNAKTDDEIITIIKGALEKATSEIRKINIISFDFEKFENELMKTMIRFESNNNIHENDHFYYRVEEIEPKYNISEERFWSLIEDAKIKGQDFNNQINSLVELLSKLNEKLIVGYEYTFRDILAKSANFNILALTKIIYGFVSDDNFLYLRCRLIAEGRRIYFDAIKNPELLSVHKVKEFRFGGEEMLSISDKAFIKKFGKETSMELPSLLAMGYMNYDEGEEMQGKELKDEELVVKYPNLFKAFNS